MDARQTPAAGSVVVGVDAGEAAQRLVDLAAAQAHRWRTGLHVVHATGLTIVPWTSEHLHRVSGVTDLSHRRAVHAAPDLTVTSATEVADPAALLVEASRAASLVVLDRGGLVQTGAVLLGATTQKVVAHAHCPVMVVPRAGGWRTAGPVVVGVDAHAHSAPAVAWAFAEASLRAAPLVALHTWWWEEANIAGPTPAGEGPRVVEEQRLLVSEMLAGFREEYPDVEVKELLVRGLARNELVEESRRAQLVVLGRRGLGGFPALVLGSVSSHVVHHAHCPVVVVPSTSDEGAHGGTSASRAPRAPRAPQVQP